MEEKKRILNVRMHKDDYRFLKGLAINYDTTMSAIIIKQVKEWSLMQKKQLDKVMIVDQ